MTYRHIHIMGASGSGTTTLGKALHTKLGLTHLDSDDFFWLLTDPPYQRKRERAERQNLLARALDKAESTGWVLSGAFCDWGDIFIPRLDLIVFLTAPTQTRVERVTQRAMAQGINVLGDQHRGFVDWVSMYESGGLDTRSRRLHEFWLARITSCPVLRLENTGSIDSLVSQTIGKEC